MPNSLGRGARPRANRRGQAAGAQFLVAGAHGDPTRGCMPERLRPRRRRVRRCRLEAGTASKFFQRKLSVGAGSELHTPTGGASSPLERKAGFRTMALEAVATSGSWFVPEAARKQGTTIQRPPRRGRSLAHG